MGIVINSLFRLQLRSSFVREGINVVSYDSFIALNGSWLELIWRHTQLLFMLPIASQNDQKFHVSIVSNYDFDYLSLVFANVVYELGNVVFSVTLHSLR